MRKKRMSILLAVVALVTLCAALVACNGGGEVQTVHTHAYTEVA